MLKNTGLGLVVALALGAAWGCSDDESSGGGAGTGGSAGSSGSAGSAGSGGSAGTSGAGGSSGSAASGGSGGIDGGDASTAGDLYLVAGTDFFSKTEVAAIDLASGVVSANVTFDDGDAVPAASGGRGFVLERTKDVVHLLTATGTIDKSIPLATGDSGTLPANPTGVAAAPGSTTAYVTLYGRNAVAIVDLGAGSVKETLDLSAYLDASDADGAVDVGTPIHDPGTNRVYMTLARVDRTTIAAPSFELACPNVPSLLIAVDATSGTIVDLNGATAGEAIPLGLVNPTDIALDAGGAKLLVLAAGCFVSAGVRAKHGAEAIAIGSGEKSVALSPGDGGYFARLISIGPSSALVNSFDALFTEHWQRWNTAQTSLGVDLDSVPAAPSWDGATDLVGVDFASADGGSTAKVVRYAIDGATKTTVVDDPWLGSFGAASASAIVKP